MSMSDFESEKRAYEMACWEDEAQSTDKGFDAWLSRRESDYRDAIAEDREAHREWAERKGV